MKILAIESSADETAAAVVEDGVKIISNAVASSAEIHAKFGGIVPELAARAHVAYIIPVINEVIIQAFPISKVSTPIEQVIKSNIDALAVTIGPGLIGSLLIGVETARMIAAVTKLPLIPVNHVLAHMYANFINTHQSYAVRPQLVNTRQIVETHNIISFPAISLVVSGGHTELYLMTTPKNIKWLGGTLDDAAGECFDKTARLLGLGNGGGASIQNIASGYALPNTKYKPYLPRPKIHDTDFNLSFSGLKTAVMREKQKLEKSNKWNNLEIIRFAYEIQEAITDVLISKSLNACQHYNAKSLLISGGVSANIRLREKFDKICSEQNINFFAPHPSLCTDNAVYIASYAYFKGVPEDWKNISAQPGLNVEL